MKYAVATLIALAAGASATIAADCVTTCGGCYDSTTHVVTCYDKYAGNCEGNYWMVMDGCSEKNASCGSTYNAYGKACADGGTAGSYDMTALTNSDGDNTCCAFTHEDIAGYEPYTDVGDHEMIDIDQALMETWLSTGYNYSQAYKVYSQGGGSVKSSSGSSRAGTYVAIYRTIMGFSKDLSGEAMYDIYNAYWGSTTYANDFVTAALMGTTDAGSGVNFGSLTDDARVQLAKKGSAYQNVWMYVLHELESAIDDCTAGTMDDDATVPCAGCHVWDEGWAFWAGSHQSTGTTDGYLAYTLAEKRCTSFGTCGAAGTSTSSADRPSYVNRQLLAEYNSGLTNLKAGSCTAAQANLDAIEVLMTIPLVQGTLQYAYKCDPNGLNAGAEACAEAYAFAAAVLPQIATCDATAGTTVKTNLIPGANVPDGYAAVKTAVESTYGCLGIKCSDIGGLWDSASSSYYSGMEACSFSPSAAPTTTKAASVGGAAFNGPNVMLSALAALVTFAAFMRA